MNVKEWLDTPPKEEEVFSLNVNGDGKYIPYEIIVEKLYQLCGHEWSTSNLQVTYFNLPNRKTLISGTIEVEVNYCLTSELGLQKITRRLAGGANYIVNSTKIPHTTASVKSLAVMSTVKPLGKQFGWGLNDDEKPDIKEVYATDESKKQQLSEYMEAITTATTLKGVELFKNTVEREDNPELTEAYNLAVKKLRKKTSPKKVTLP